VFEPSGIKDLRGFEKAIRLSHVVKYSHERLGYLDDITMEINAALVVETLSESGLRYRLSPKIGGSGVWNNLDAFPVDDLRDAAGSGDWCTAGLIFQLGTHGAPGLQNGSARRVLEALNFGQALAALNCHFEGPRGAMYGLERDEFASALEAILRNRGPKAPPSKFLSAGATHFIAGLCPGCSTKEVRVRAK
jgi:fructokinase